MATLKIIGNKYKEDTAICRLIQYAFYQKDYDIYNNLIPGSFSSSPFIGCYNLFLGNPYCENGQQLILRIYQQMLFTTNYYKKDFGQLLHHFILNFDTLNNENWISPETACEIAVDVCSHSPLNSFQVIYGIHTNRPSHIHIHFIVCSTSPYDGRKLPDKKAFYSSIAKTITAALNNRKPPTPGTCNICYENCKLN